MQQRTLGNRTVSAIGLGGMPMSIEGRPDEARSIATIHAALDAGITLVDTADAYHLHPTDVGHNELLIGKALRLAGAGPEDVLVATKGGHRRPGDGSWYQILLNFLHDGVNLFIIECFFFVLQYEIYRVRLFPFR